ncbi:glycosyl hydrolase [Methylorubrum sp. SB2]|uniref:glycosyl hydrolase n=1 Tax=Methylorubrum subtropicum TaxID=3138812 RepID=UPI00313AEF87
MTALGAYFGNDPSALPAYEEWLGREVDNVLFYLNDWSWKDFDNSIGWATSLWKPMDRPVLWSVPLTVTGTSLAQVATGDYNDHFLKAAQALAQSKPSEDGFIYVRVGWEFNGSWMPWAAKGNEAAFIGAYRELVDTFREVSDKFKFVWDVNAGGEMNPEKAYPGDAYVDVVGMDFYYNKEWDNADPAKAFLDKVNMSYGLKWQQDFAAQHGKQTSVSEWGVKTDDSGAFVKAALAWMNKYGMLFQNYWESDYANFTGTLHDGSKPTVGDIFKDLFGSVIDTPAAPAKPDLAPSVTEIAASAPNAANGIGTAVVGETVTLTLTLSEAVTVASASKFSLGLNDGGTALFDAAASDATHLVFRHKVLADQVANDIAVTGVNLNGAVVRDAAGNNAVFTGAVGNPDGVLKIDGYTGSAGNDVFRGTNGADIFNGRGGDDTYYVNHAGDKVNEGVKGGYDTVVTSVSYVLGYYQEVEKLTTDNAAGKAAINLEGNSFDQTLEGNAGNNVLDGSAGADKLYGFAGNDTYYVDHINDQVFEAKGGGYDTLIASANYRLAAGQEIELIRFADSMKSGQLVTGNEFNQTLIGNKNDNIIDGGAGNDIMTGGAGADTFVFSTRIGPGNVDRITDFSQPDDTIGLARSEFWNLSMGKLADTQFKNLDTGKVDADDRVLYKQSTGELFYDWDGSGKQAAILLGVLDNKAPLHASDILVV